MYTIYEVFPDGAKYPMFYCDDFFTCEVWVSNNFDCTSALMQGRSELIIEKQKAE